ncbi:MAG: HAD-IIB family hydrolase [Pseudomonadaceae bacterium]|nr:HAD-IIB family hydrolase [Pseudomonadaceae bacterium]
MKAKALVFDLDGTLLVGEDLPGANADALVRASKSGLHIMIATARWRQMAQKIMAEVGVTGPAIACSGAQVYDSVSQRDLFDERLPEAFVQELYALCDEERCVATVTVSDRTLIKLDGQPDPSLLSEEMYWVPKLAGADPSLPRVAAIQGSNANARIRAELEPKWKDEVHFKDSIGPTGKIIVAITAAAATKGAALGAACTHLNIQPSAVIAFGDADNDIDMFAAAGQSVAMGQAEAHVKAAASVVTRRHDEDGVAYAINYLLDNGDLPNVG